MFPTVHYQDLILLTMEGVWKIITTVRFLPSRLAIACLKVDSFSKPKDAVASSSSRMGLFFRIARAMDNLIFE